MPPVVEKPSRIEIIDAVRGFALFGIILVHFTEQFYAGALPKIHQDIFALNNADKIVMGLKDIFVMGKFYMIFSFLFGLSFFIQLDRSDGSARFFLRFAWRMVILFIIGFIHQIHFRGDILTVYALLGFGLLFCYRLPDKVLLVLSLLLVFDFPSIGIRTVGALSHSNIVPAFYNPDQKLLEAYYTTVTTGSYLEIARTHVLTYMSKFDFMIDSGRIYITFGLFLLGLYAGRKKLFERLELFRMITRYALWTLLGCVVLVGLMVAVSQGLKIQLSESKQIILGGAIYDAFNAALAALYVCLFVKFFQREKWKTRLSGLYYLGRMGLTSYLTQAAIGVLLLFSYGLNLIGHYGASVWAGVAVLVFVLQMIISEWWLKRFCYGPVEWAWRSLTYFRLQPFRQKR